MTRSVNVNKTVTVTVTPTITAGAYSANDVVGGLLTFTLADSNGASGIVRSARIVDGDNEKAACKLYLFSSAPQSLADNAAFDFTDDAANLAKCVGRISFANADYVTVGADAAVWAKSQDIDFDTETGVLYGYLVCDATPTYGNAADLSITLNVSLL